MAPGGQDGIRAFVERRVQQLLDEYPAWPKNMLLLECERYGIYQQAAGDILHTLLQEGEVGMCELDIQIDAGEDESPSEQGPYSCFTRPQNTSPDVPDIVERLGSVMEAFTSNGHFGDLIAYTAICKVYDELNISDMEVFPEGDFQQVLYHTERRPDAMWRIPGEWVPVEVYNGRDTVDTPKQDYHSQKYNQCRDLSRGPDRGRVNPMLISRRSTQSFRDELIEEWDGTSIDTDCILLCENDRESLEDDLEFFNIRELVEFVPRMQATDGSLIGGEGYSNFALNNRVSNLMPPEEMAENLISEGRGVDKIPQQYMERLRGGIHLHYVNSFYRRRDAANEPDASRVLTHLYHDLLRSDGLPRGEAIEDAFQATRREQQGNQQQRKEMIIEIAQDMVNQLIEENVIFARSGDLHARRSQHPQQDLSFE